MNWNFFAKHCAATGKRSLTYPRWRFIGLLIAGLLAGVAADAGPITWNTPMTITGNADISTNGIVVFAYDWNSSPQSVNGVNFTAPGSGVSLSSGFGGHNYTRFVVGTAAPATALVTAYQNILTGGQYTTNGTAETLTLNGLTSGHQYRVQIWVDDSRNLGGGLRSETVTSPGGNTVTLSYPANALGTLGQYAIGTFTATATNQVITLTGNASTQINALQLRDLSSSPVLAITTQPQGQDATVGSTVTFSVAAYGSGSLAYQWSLNGSPLASATNSSLVLSNVGTNSAGYYTVLVTDAVTNVLSYPAVLQIVTAIDPLDPAVALNAYNPVWTSPSQNDTGAMPLGNGEVGLMLWVEADGDLQFYIARTDSRTELDRLVKLGKVRLRLSPNPFASGQPFRQELRLRDGRVDITAGFPTNQVTLKAFVDSGSPTIHIAGSCASPVNLTAIYETWRNQVYYGNSPDSPLRGSGYSNLYESADVVDVSDTNRLAFYHRNAWSCVPLTAGFQFMTPYLNVVPETLTNRTFGGWMTLSGAQVGGSNSLASATPLTNFDLKISTESTQTTTLSNWLAQVAATNAMAPDAVAAMQRTGDWWSNYWNRSWLFVSPAQSDSTPDYLTRSYVLSKWMSACGGLGKFPIMFNGSLWTVNPNTSPITISNNPDYRNWGQRYFYQNTRHHYLSMLARGEPEFLQPFFNYYSGFMALNRGRAAAWYGASGQFVNEMTTSFGLIPGHVYGYNRTGVPNWFCTNSYGGSVTVSPGLEILSLMLDYFDYSSDTAFLQATVVPYAQDLLRFIETAYPARDTNGDIVIGPINSVEAYWSSTNATTVVSGMNSALERLLALPDGLLASTQTAYFASIKAITPPLPLQQVNSQTVFAPAQFWGTRNQVEEPELYPVFPFRLYGIGRTNRALGINTFQQIPIGRGYFKPFVLNGGTYQDSYSGWQQSGMEAALLGLTDYAETALTNNCQLYNPGYRFQATWGQIYDSIPDGDHGANILNTAQLMAFQTLGDKIFLLPAWPRDWNCSFKFHAPQATTISGLYSNGVIQQLEITPASRVKDVILMLTNVPVLATGSATVTGYDAWRLSHFAGQDLVDTSLWSPAADPDGDGMPNLIEYLLAGMDPNVANPMPVPVSVQIGGENYLQMQLLKRPQAASGTVCLQLSHDLANWFVPSSSGDGNIIVVSDSTQFTVQLRGTTTTNTYFRIVAQAQ
jgi:hypothetical protein